MQIDKPISIALILFVIAILIFFLVMPEYKTFKNLQADLGTKMAEFNAEHAYFSAITETYSKIQSHKDDIEKINDALPAESSLGKLVYFFEQKTMENGLILKSLFLSKSSASAGSGKVSDLTFSLNLMGGYSALENFIKSLEKSSRIFEVNSISFGGQSSGADSGDQPQFQLQETYSFSLEIKTQTY